VEYTLGHQGGADRFPFGSPLLVAPLDATTMVKLEHPMLERIFGAGTPMTAQVHALYKLWGKVRPTLFDPVAVTLSFHEAFCHIEELRLEVDAEGFTRERDGQPNARVATSIRTDDFLSWYVERIVNLK
jgi:inosine-uridine nucleoside N-ribohydrolase